MASSDGWRDLEPAAWVAARGEPTHRLASAHFVVKWGPRANDEPLHQRAERALGVLERAFARFCTAGEPDFFVELPRPYKMNVYVGGTGLVHPGDPTYAHQGATPDEPLPGVRKQPVLCVSAIALGDACALVHEFMHCLQFVSGGFRDSAHVGFLWEAHAEYLVHRFDPLSPQQQWTHHLDHFLRTSNAPIDMTRATERGGPSGRQYCVWPFLAWLDKLCTGSANALWHADAAHRAAHGASRPPLATALAAVPELGERGLPAAMAEYAADCATADWFADARVGRAVLGKGGAQRAACDVLSPRRLARLARAPLDAPATLARWAVDAEEAPPAPAGPAGATARPTAPAGLSGWSALYANDDEEMPLKPNGVCVHRLVMRASASEPPRARLVVPRACARPMVYSLTAVWLDTASAERHRCGTVHARSGGGGGRDAEGLDGVGGAVHTLTLRLPPAAAAAPERCALLLAVTATPCADPVSALAWDVSPESVPTCPYALALSAACAVHADCERGGTPERPAVRLSAPRAWPAARGLVPLLELASRGLLVSTAAAPRDDGPARAGLDGAAPADGGPETWLVRVGTGRPQLQPVAHRLGGASWTARDLRSGAPREVNDVLIGSPLHCPGHEIVGVQFAYRYVVGYGGGEPGAHGGPSFSLLARAAAGADDGGGGTAAAAAAPPVVLYDSGAHDWAAAPFDAKCGGHPTNYSAPVRARALSGARAPLDTPMQLLLRFSNGRRNLHLQGARWAADGDFAADLELSLTLARALPGERWWVRVPTGLGSVEPRAPASLTRRDVRSGAPGQMSYVRLAALPRMPAVVCVGARMCYSYVCGYSDRRAGRAPSFQLLARRLGAQPDVTLAEPCCEGVCAGRRHAAPSGGGRGGSGAEAPEVSAETTLYESPPLDVGRYSYDRALGGHETNYSPPIDVRVGDVGDGDGAQGGGALSVALDAGLELWLRFENGDNNVHLQGGAWRRADGSDPALAAEFGLSLRVERITTTAPD